MAFTEFYCQTTGSNLNAGSTTSDAAVYTGVGDSDGTSKFTPSDGSTPASSVAVGDFASVYVTSGATVAVFIGRVTVVAAGVNGAITVSTTAKSGTFPANSGSAHTITCKTGGAWQGPNGATGFPFGFITNALMISGANNRPRVNMKNNVTYSISSGVSHSNAAIRFEGYSSTPGDGGRATIDGSTNAIALVTISGVDCAIAHFIISNNGSTGSNAGLTLSSGPMMATDIVVHDVRGSGIVVSSSNNLLESCETYNCNSSNTSSLGGTTLTATATLINCISHDNTGSNNNGFYNSAAVTFINCISDTNGLHGFSMNCTGQSILVSCDAYNNGGDGVRQAQFNTTLTARNCNFIKNGGWGVNLQNNDSVGLIQNCGFGSGTQANTSGTTTLPAPNGIIVTGSVTYASGVTPWVDPANGDFRINLAVAKNTGRGAFTQTQASYAGTVAYPDIGAAQHLEQDRAFTFLK